MTAAEGRRPGMTVNAMDRFIDGIELAAAAFIGIVAIDIFATLVLLFVVTVQTAMLFDKVRSTCADHVLTYDLHLPTWPFFAVAWAGDVSAVVLIAVRTYRLIFYPEKLSSEPIAKAVE